MSAKKKQTKRATMRLVYIDFWSALKMSFLVSLVLAVITVVLALLFWEALDRVHTKHPDMVLLHGGSPRGAEFIASRWADHRRVPQISFKPDWTTHGKAAPFRRNDVMLDVLPIGVMHFAGNGIQDNLRDKARKLGIPEWTFGGV